MTLCIHTHTCSLPGFGLSIASDILSLALESFLRIPVMTLSFLTLNYYSSYTQQRSMVSQSPPSNFLLPPFPVRLPMCTMLLHWVSRALLSSAIVQICCLLSFSLIVLYFFSRAFRLHQLITSPLCRFLNSIWPCRKSLFFSLQKRTLIVKNLFVC